MNYRFGSGSSLQRRMIAIPRMLIILVVFLLIMANEIIKGEEWVRPTKPDYSDLETINPSEIHKDPAFVQACKEMAGYYKDSRRNPSLKSTIVIVGVNNGYKDFFHNFKCYADRLGIKFLPISLDEGIYGYLTSNKITTTYLLGDIPGRDKVAAEPSRFGGKNFNLIGCRKMEAVGAALKLGYDVVFSDVDIAILRDPIDYLFLKGFDYAHSVNNGCARKWSFNDTMEGNTGFYAVRSNPATIRTWDLTYRLCSRSPKYDDQTIFWLILRTNDNPAPRPLKACPKPDSYYHSKNIFPVPKEGSLKSFSLPENPIVVTNCPLDDCLFSAGNIRDFAEEMRLANILRSRKDSAVMVHANWMNGKDNKKSAMVRAGLWIARRTGHSKDSAFGQSKHKQKGITGNWTCHEPGLKFTYKL